MNRRKYEKLMYDFLVKIPKHEIESYFHIHITPDKILGAGQAGIVINLRQDEILKVTTDITEPAIQLQLLEYGLNTLPGVFAISSEEDVLKVVKRELYAYKVPKAIPLEDSCFRQIRSHFKLSKQKVYSFLDELSKINQKYAMQEAQRIKSLPEKDRSKAYEAVKTKYIEELEPYIVHPMTKNLGNFLWDAANHDILVLDVHAKNLGFHSKNGRPFYSEGLAIYDMVFIDWRI